MRLETIFFVSKRNSLYFLIIGDCCLWMYIAQCIKYNVKRSQTKLIIPLQILAWNAAKYVLHHEVHWEKENKLFCPFNDTYIVLRVYHCNVEMYCIYIICCAQSNNCKRDKALPSSLKLKLFADRFWFWALHVRIYKLV